MSEAAPIQSEIQTLEPALVEQVEEINVKEIHAETEVIENGAIENGIETQLMESAAEGKQKYLVNFSRKYRQNCLAMHFPAQNILP